MVGPEAELNFGEFEVLAAAKHLVNGHTITEQSGGMVMYFHILFDRHELIFVGGVWSESFHPGEQVIGGLRRAGVIAESW